MRGEDIVKYIREQRGWKKQKQEYYRMQSHRNEIQRISKTLVGR
jgi:hypothetical protein